MYVYPDICFTVFQEIEILNVIWTMPEGKDHVILVSLSGKLLLCNEKKKVKQNPIFDVKSTKMTTLEAKKQQQSFLV